MSAYYLSLVGTSFLFAFVTFPYFIEKIRESGVVVRDYYKSGNRMVPTEGGLVEIFIYLLMISIFGLVGFQFDYISIFVLVLFAFFGALDDILNPRHMHKIVFPALFAFPLISIVQDTSIALPFLRNLELGILYLYFVVPAYIMVTANLANMHSGFNGLASGTSILVLFSLILKSSMMGNVENLYFIFPLLGIALAFHYYNLYPSQIFEGDVGSFMLGSAIGIVIILQKLEFVGFVMLIPHIVNFLMYVYWRIKGIPHVKFGKVRKDGTLEVPNPLTLKWLLPYYFRVTERTSVIFVFCLTAVFCMIGLVIPV